LVGFLILFCLKKTCEQLLNREIPIDNSEFYELIQNIQIVSSNLNGEEIIQDANDKENLLANDVLSKINNLNEQMNIVKLDLIKAKNGILTRTRELSEAERNVEVIENCLFCSLLLFNYNKYLNLIVKI
jgi:ribulose-5-phosphate 4-epimerase/fuculose-1-phosphate aldolase